MGRQPELPRVPDPPGTEHGGRRADRATPKGRATLAEGVGPLRAVPREEPLQLRRLRPAPRRRVFLRPQPPLPQESLMAVNALEPVRPGGVGQPGDSLRRVVSCPSGSSSNTPCVVAPA